MILFKTLNTRNRKMQKQIFSVLFGVIVLCFSAKAQEFSYQTFSLSKDNVKALSTEDKVITPLLYVATSKDGILYAGSASFGRCLPLIDKDQEFAALKDGMLECNDLGLKVKNGVITEALTATQNFALNLKQLDSMTLIQQEVVYKRQKPKKSKAEDAFVRLRFHCAKDSKVQDLLQTMYGEKFDCKNAKAVFEKKAQDSLQRFLEASLEENVTNKAKAIEEMLQFAPFENYSKDSLYYFDSNLFVFSRGDYFYTGGAHGMYNESGVLLSKNGIVDLETIIDFDNPQLKDVLWNAYQKFLQEKEMEGFAEFKTFEVSKEVLVDYDGFVFLYQPYELAPYSYGVVELKIPFTQMAEFGKFENSPLSHLFAQ